MNRRNSLELEQAGRYDLLHNQSLFLCHKPDFFDQAEYNVLIPLYTHTFHIESPHEYIQKVEVFMNGHIFGEKKCISLYRAVVNVK